MKEKKVGRPVIPNSKSKRNKSYLENKKQTHKRINIWIENDLHTKLVDLSKNNKQSIAQFLTSFIKNL